jgi:hypothetical protein
MNLKDKLNQIFSEEHIDIVLNEGISVIGAIDSVRMALPEIKNKVSEEKIATVFQKMVDYIEQYFNLKNKSLQLQSELLDIELKKYAETRFENLPVVQKLKEKSELTKKSQTEHEESYKNFQKIKETSYNIISNKGEVGLVHPDQETKKADKVEQQIDKVQSAVIDDIKQAETKPETKPEPTSDFDVPELNPDEINKTAPEPTKVAPTEKPKPETIKQKLQKMTNIDVGNIEPQSKEPFSITPKQIDITPFLNQQAKEIWNNLPEDQKIPKYEEIKKAIRKYRKEIATQILKLSTSQMDESAIDDIFQLVPNLKASIKTLSPENLKKLEEYIQSELMPKIIEDVSKLLIEPNIDTKIMDKPIDQKIRNVFNPPEETAALEPKSVEPTKPEEPKTEPTAAPVQPEDTDNNPIDIQPTAPAPTQQDSPENTIVEPPKPVETSQEPSIALDLKGQGKANFKLHKRPSGKFQIEATNQKGINKLFPGEFTKEEIAAKFTAYKNQLGIPDSELPKYNAWVNPGAEEQARKHAEIKAKMDAEKEQLKSEPAPNPDAEIEQTPATPIVKAGKGRKKKKVD